MTFHCIIHEEELPDLYHGSLSKEVECYIQRCAQKHIDMVTTLMAFKIVGSKNGTWHLRTTKCFLSIWAQGSGQTPEFCLNFVLASQQEQPLK